jgi:hypothetical protein
MPICWSLQPASQYTVVTFSDPYTFQQWEAAFAEMVAARACEPWRRFLIDRRNSMPPTSEFVGRMVYALSGHAALTDHTRVAVVVSTDAGFGMGRMAQMSAEASRPAISMRVFRSYEAAEGWLNVKGQQAT